VSRMDRNLVKYLVQWTRYDSVTSQSPNFVDELPAAGEFSQSHPAKLGPCEIFAEDI